MEYVGHLISSTGSSFTHEKRLQVLDFPLSETKKALLQFIGLVNYFRDHVPHMTEMVRPLRNLIDLRRWYKGFKKLTWTPESIEAFHFCWISVSDCQEIYFLEDTATPILQTVHGDEWTSPRHSLFQQIPHWITVELVSKGGRMLWHLLWRKDNRYFILKTDHKNLTYINVTFTGKVLPWKLYLQDKDFDLFHVPGKEEHQFVPIQTMYKSCTSTSYFG